jgi:hypothetical protein
LRPAQDANIQKTPNDGAQDESEQVCHALCSGQDAARSFW